MRNLAKGNTNPNEKAAAEKKAGGPKLIGEKEEIIHEKMYKIATDKYNPFSVGGSENIHDFE